MSLEISADSGAKPSRHEWRFFRTGGFDQVRIDSGADLLALEQLDQKLWVALSCPVYGIEFDAETMALIDTDKDGHVRAPEVIAAIRWAAALLKDNDSLVRGADTILLSAINDAIPEGRYLLSAARRILADLGKPDAETISVADTTDTTRLLTEMRFNGDGVITPSVAEEGDLQGVVQDIMACCGALPDHSGEQGVTAETLDRFFAQAQSYADWWRQTEWDEGVWFLGEATLAAREAYQAVKVKADDYFTRCRMAAFDTRAAVPLSRSVEDYQSLASRSLSAVADEVAAFPLAVIEANKPLPLLDEINPAWIAAVQALRAQVVSPLLGERTALSVDEWEALGAKFAPMEKWLGTKPETAVEKLGIARIRTILDGGYRSAIEALIAEDKALEGEVKAISEVGKLLRYCRDLHTLANNFVSFRNFYTGVGKATFQVGTLYLDGRSCELCVRVDDVNKHAVLANLSGMCLVYCECVRSGGADKMFIAAAVTAGDSDQLMAGRNGVFYDRKGLDWDATIVRILDHPVSIRQAFWMPYKRVSKMIGEQIQKFAASKSQAAEGRMGKAALEAHEAKPPAPPFDIAKFAGIFAAIGLAIGALGTAAAALLTGLLGLKWWQMPFAVAGLMLLVSGPAMLVAWFRLKRRNLGPILDANGWAVNARARINIPFGASLTGVAELPEGTGRSLADPFADKKHIWPYVAIVLVAGMLLWGMWLSGSFGK